MEKKNQKFNFYEFAEKNAPILEMALKEANPDMDNSKIKLTALSALYSSWDQARKEVTKVDTTKNAIAMVAVIAGYFLSTTYAYGSLVNWAGVAASVVGTIYILSDALLGLGNRSCYERQDDPEKDYRLKPDAEGSKKVTEKAQIEINACLARLAVRKMKLSSPGNP